MDDQQCHLPPSGRAFLVRLDSLHLVAETIQNAVQEPGFGRPSRRFFVFAILPLARVAGFTGCSLDPTLGRSRERSLGVVDGCRRAAGLSPPSIEVGSACLEDVGNGRTEPGVVISGTLGRSDGQGSDEEAPQPWGSQSRRHPRRSRRRRQPPILSHSEKAGESVGNRLTGRLLIVGEPGRGIYLEAEPLPSRRAAQVDSGERERQ